MSDYKNSKEVSDDLNNVLDHLTGTSDSRVEEEFLNDQEKEIGASRCTWYRGCYYCKINGRWRLIRCIA